MTQRMPPLAAGTLVLLGVFLFSATLLPSPALAESATPPEGLSEADWQSIRAAFEAGEQDYLKASNTGAGDRFGAAVAVSGDTLVVGAWSEASGATGVDGDQGDNSAQHAGAVYVFVRSGRTWSQEAYIKASNTDASDFFGTSVAISGDTIVVGAPGEDSGATGVDGDQSDDSASLAGAAYVFVRSGSTWSQQGYLKASNTDTYDSFGESVAVWGDTIVVGAPEEDSRATGIDGNQSDNGGIQAGAAYVFVRSGSTWSQQAYVKASNTASGDSFGVSVAISESTVVVGALSEDSSASGVNGDQGDNSATSAGAAYVFVREGTTWSQQAYVKASNPESGDRFGGGVAISDDTVVVGALAEDSRARGIDGDQGDNTADSAGAAYVFVREGTTWSQQAYVKASNPGVGDAFARVLAISGDSLVVGAYREDGRTTRLGGSRNSGAAYLLVRSGATWRQEAYLKAARSDVWDAYGFAVAISESTVVVGALNEDSGATGVNGDQIDNSATDAGAVYVLSNPLLFADGFETGSASAWSARTP